MYASKTSVPVARSKAEIERTLEKYGAESFAYASKVEMAMIEFQMKGKRIRFVIPMPEKPSDQATNASWKTYEQIVRQKWRALCLVVKAKLEAVESEITTMEQEFLAHIVLPGGQTFGDSVIPQIDKIYETGKVPAISWEGA